jgi:hypothetical protein
MVAPSKDRIVEFARKNKHSPKASLYYLRKLRSHPCARTKANNMSLRPIEILQKINHDPQRNVPLLVVTTSKKEKKGKPTAQQIVSPLSLSSCDSVNSMKTCCNPMPMSSRKRVRFADAAQVFIVASYRKSLSKVEKAQIWWTLSELHEFKKRNLKIEI